MPYGLNNRRSMENLGASGNLKIYQKPMMVEPKKTPFSNVVSSGGSTEKFIVKTMQGQTRNKIKEYQTLSIASQTMTSENNLSSKLYENFSTAKLQFPPVSKH
jgi:hypothetical protein